MDNATSTAGSWAIALILSMVVACAGDEEESRMPGGDGDARGSGGQTMGDGDGDGDGDGAGFPDSFADADTGPDRNKVTAGNVCDRLATIQCAGEKHCCDDPGRDFATCKEVMRRGCVQDIFMDAVTADPVSGFDAAIAETAFTEFEQRALACDPSVASWGSGNSGLRAMLVGTVSPGGNCMPPNVANAASAAAHLTSCLSGDSYACQPDVLMWRCEPRTAAGGDCFTDANCQDGLYCDNPDLLLLRASCVTRKPEGQSCSSPNECASLMCKRGSCVAADRQAAFCLQN